MIGSRRQHALECPVLD